MNHKILIQGSTIISQDETLGVIQNGDVLIVDGKICEVAPHIACEDAQRIDGTDKILLPGFIDAHRHNWESLIRSTGVDWTLEQYFTAVKKILGPQYMAEDLYLAQYIGALECLDTGITTLFDWFHNNNGPDYSDAAVKGLEDSRIRFVFGYSNSIYGELPVSNVPLDGKDFLRVKEQYFTSETGKKTLALATRGPQFLEKPLVIEELKLARETDSLIAMHVGDGSWGKRKPLIWLKENDLLKQQMTFIHCNTLLDEELEIIGDLGASVVTCPEVELNMGHGFLPTLRERACGLEPALGIDVCTTVPGDMFGAMRSELAGVRSVVNAQALNENVSVDPLPLLATDVLRFATVNGAKACGLEKKIGTITPGKEADIILLNTCDFNMIPFNHPINSVVESANPSNVDFVMVAGEIVKQNKELLGVDLKALKKKAELAAFQLFERAGITDPMYWIPPVYIEETGKI